MLSAGSTIQKTNSEQRAISESSESTDGLTAGELTLALTELDGALQHLEVRGIAQLEAGDDLLIFLRPRSEETRGSTALHLVPGRGRGRVSITARRWPNEAQISGPQIDRLEQALVGKRYVGSQQADGEQRCRLLFADDQERFHLELELFGNRGFWVLTDSEGRMLVMSRLAKRGGKTMCAGSKYEPPARFAKARAEPDSRFSSPCLETIDAIFSAADRASEAGRQEDKLRGLINKARKKLAGQIQGLEQQRDAMHRSGDLRQQADLLLAFGFSADKSADQITVDDPTSPGVKICIPLVPGRSIQAQADSLYKKARKYEDGLPICEQRLASLARGSADLSAALDLIDQEDSEGPDRALQVLTELGLAGKQAKAKGVDSRLRKITRGESFRRATSCEGYLIMIGRNHRQNDKLSTSVARGNDLWFHIGRGQVGSHVVLRLPKGKTASLESLLDAGSLAVHFSKSRGEPIAEVIYTQAKHVTKPKGLAPGKVLADHVKALRVDHDSARLQRLLNSADDHPPKT